MSILRLEGTPSRASLAGLTPRVHFALPSDIDSIVSNFLTGTDKTRYQELLVSLKSASNSDENIINLLESCYKNVNNLDQRVHSLVIAILNLNWNSSSDALASKFQQFLLELVATHTNFTSTVLESLLRKFYGFGDEPWPSTKPSVKEELHFSRLHETINQILKIIPMSADVLLQACDFCFPFMKRGSRVNQSYVYNLFKICTYRPEMRSKILSLIIKKVISIDVQIPRKLLEALEGDEEEMETDAKMDDTETVFTMDDVSRSAASRITSVVDTNMQQQLAQTLDLLMEQIFVFVKEFCSRDADENEIIHHQSIFKDFLEIFEHQLLNVHGSHHVQFCMFYLCTLRPILPELFLTALWSKVTRMGENAVVRQTAAHYIASVVSRGQFVSVNATRCILQQMSKWCHAYVEAQQDATICDVKMHGIFYSVCQGLFYIVAFRHADLMATEKGLKWVQSLGLAKLVTSRLNPLKPCLPAVAQNFATVTRTYQIAYCFTVLEKNSRSQLPTVSLSGQQTVTNLNCFFPFDPYLLNRSAVFINDQYREYEPLEQPGDERSDSENEETFGTPPKESLPKCMSPGSFTHLISPTKMSRSLDKFSYGSTPGFKAY
ncbi:RNA polymerase I-specific transcription initiation factor RRN3 [Cloeon dipterum]|uniref:RNA polymerase I-specific transcription initiation factor RRN3 n=1 Tax=Cloeon dipterum TaxID=197152 RepID=UPI00321FB93D